MKALLMAVLAVALAGCTATPHPEMAGARKSTAAKIHPTKGTKTAAPKTKAVAKAKHVGTTGSVPAALPKTSDPITEKAKAAIAAMMENPDAAEFYNLQRAQKNLLHRRVDTICGHVRAKNSPGRGGMPFLYIVGQDREDEAYLVNGRSHVSETVHGALCK